MSYVPPHMRGQTNEWTTIQKKTTKKTVEKPKKKEYKDEFPSLNNTEVTNTITKSDKPTLATLFKNSLNRKQKKKQPKIKKGWVLLTPQGLIDSLSPEERKYEDEEYERRMYIMRLEIMTREMDRRTRDRQENDHTYLWESEKTRIEFDKFNVDDDDSEYFTESDSELYDELGEDDELYFEN